MSRVRIVGGDVESLRKLGRSETLQSKGERVDTGCLSDPQGMLAAAWSRFEEIPEDASEKTLARARELCKNHAVLDLEDKPLRFQAPQEPDLDLIIVLHPHPRMVNGANGELVPLERYMVFARSQDTVRGTCYACNNAERAGRKIGRHDCWRKRTWLDWVPFAFAWAHGCEDAEDIAKEMRSAWEVTADQKYDDNARINWSRVVEIPFSSDFLLNNLVGKQEQWNSMSESEDDSWVRDEE